MWGTSPAVEPWRLAPPWCPRPVGEQYGVAVNTVRRAVRDLLDQGLVITVPIKGSFVRAENSPQDATEGDEGAR
ncbi:GntR family transcriptional regulator [Streptomyces sp. MBT57]|nr:GntR family transcriptional regulator [Streptomyces sp. MBT57]